MGEYEIGRLQLFSEVSNALKTMERLGINDFDINTYRDASSTRYVLGSKHNVEVYGEYTPEEAMGEMAGIFNLHKYLREKEKLEEDLLAYLKLQGLEDVTVDVYLYRLVVIHGNRTLSIFRVGNMEDMTLSTLLEKKP